MGNYTNLKHVVRDAYNQEGIKILTFRSSRAKLRFDSSREVEIKVDDNEEEGATGKKRKIIKILQKLSNATYLQAYNCDSSIPKPDSADRAKKQIYRAEYVLNHFVHYSTATQSSSLEFHHTNTKKRQRWKQSYLETSERVTDEHNEATM
eukprot:CAMPEP_0194153340 /NCGR_PEP_ID=MMETSP0152-20130528/56112_1 /TAXON_ID=1049557 /ORGANISM="Thalassiothrix antarctica, Strain L6-D1" /LENGTH=149 /DNA_ID=CAMNT_0038858569 /DNA_START=292 /DNA_END=738 /DNA_ORIENTATION=-